jgi:hypothetical protein
VQKFRDIVLSKSRLAVRQGSERYALEQRLKELKVKQQRIDARRRSLESRRARRDDLRRKILVGAVVLAKVEQGGFQRSTLDEWLDADLTREDDRALFGLAQR